MIINWTDKNMLISATAKSSSIAQLLTNLGISKVGTNYKTAKKWLLHHNIDITHFTSQYGKVPNGGGKVATVSRELVFCVDSHVRQSVLRRAVIRYNIFSYECVECYNNGMWNNKQLTLQLDHINGINNDNRVENLRWLCPNCHTQTTTHGGKGHK